MGEACINSIYIFRSDVDKMSHLKVVRNFIIGCCVTKANEAQVPNFLAVRLFKNAWSYTYQSLLQLELKAMPFGVVHYVLCGVCITRDVRWVDLVIGVPC